MWQSNCTALTIGRIGWQARLEWMHSTLIAQLYKMTNLPHVLLQTCNCPAVQSHSPQRSKPQHCLRNNPSWQPLRYLLVQNKNLEWPWWPSKAKARRIHSMVINTNGKMDWEGRFLLHGNGPEWQKHIIQTGSWHVHYVRLKSSQCICTIKLVVSMYRAWNWGKIGQELQYYKIIGHICDYLLVTVSSHVNVPYLSLPTKVTLTYIPDCSSLSMYKVFALSKGGVPLWNIRRTCQAILYCFITKFLYIEHVKPYRTVLSLCSCFLSSSCRNEYCTVCVISTCKCYMLINNTHSCM